MRHYLLLFSLLLSLFSCRQQPLEVWLVDPLEAVYPDSNSLDNYSDRWEADFPLGTEAEVLVLVKTERGKTIRINASLDNHKLPLTAISQLIDVPVEQNTGIHCLTWKNTIK